MLVFCMKRILIILISILLILSSCFSANCVTRTTYKFLNNSKLYYFADSKNNYIVSVKGKTAIVNKVGYGYSTIKTEAEITKCNFTGSYFHFFSDNIKGKIGVVRFNYNSGKYETITMNDGTKTRWSLCSVDKGNNYYFVDYYDRTLLHKYSSKGNLVNTYQFDSNINQIDTTNGTYQFVLTSSGLYYIKGNTIYSTSNDYNIFPISMVNDEYYCGNGKICTLFNNTKYGNYKENKTALLSNGIAKISGNKIVYSDFNSSTNKEYSFNFNIEYLYGYKDRIIVTKGSNIYIVKTDELKSKKANTTRTIENNNTKTYGIYTNAYTIGDKYITGVSPNTTIATFKKNVSYDGYDIAFIKNGSVVSSGKIGTGMIVRFTGNNEVVERTFIIKGDVNCTGTVNSKDTDTYMNFLLGLEGLTDEAMIACDINNDGVLDNSDLVLMAKLRE